MKKALVLAGGLPQIKLIKELQSRGYFVVLADYYENPIAKPYADKFYKESTLDLEAIRKLALIEKVDRIITCCTDQALETVTRLSGELNLPCYLEPDIGLSVTNKKYMKKVFVENGISTARYQTVNSVQEIEYINFPMVVKPADCNSSKGVIKVFSEEELKEAVNNALNYSRTNTAIIEEFIEGNEISVDLFICNGKAKVICYSVSDKIKDNKHFVIFRGQYPPNLSKAVLYRIENMAQRLADVFQLQNGPMLIQLLQRGDDIFIVEFSARTGGCVKYHMIELVSGIDVIKLTVDVFEGKKVEVNPIYSDKYVVNEFIYCSKGKFDSLEGFEECVKEGVLEGVFPLKTSGELFEQAESSGDRVAAITIVADSYDEYIKKHNYVAEKVRVLDLEKKDMMRHDLFPVYEGDHYEQYREFLE